MKSKLQTRRGAFGALLILTLCGTTMFAQENLLLNTKADQGTQDWRSSGRAAVEEFNGNNVFVIRREADDRAAFSQDVNLSPSDAGKYALLIGFGSSERINRDGAITGLPYLYGYMLRSNSSTGGTINSYLQGQQMLCSSSIPDIWAKMYGVFRVPENTVGIRFFLEQAERKGVPQNGSAARFDNVGLYLFKTEEAALNFAKGYR